MHALLMTRPRKTCSWRRTSAPPKVAPPWPDAVGKLRALHDVRVHRSNGRECVPKEDNVDEWVGEMDRRRVRILGHRPTARDRPPLFPSDRLRPPHEDLRLTGQSRWPQVADSPTSCGLRVLARAEECGPSPSESHTVLAKDRCPASFRSFVYTELCSSGTRGRPPGTVPSTESHSRRREPCSVTPMASAPFGEGVAVSATGPGGDGPHARGGLYREEKRQ